METLSLDASYPAICEAISVMAKFSKIDERELLLLWSLYSGGGTLNDIPHLYYEMISRTYNKEFASENLLSQFPMTLQILSTKMEKFFSNLDYLQTKKNEIFHTYKKPKSPRTIKINHSFNSKNNCADNGSQFNFSPDFSDTKKRKRPTEKKKRKRTSVKEPCFKKIALEKFGMETESPEKIEIIPVVKTEIITQEIIQEKKTEFIQTLEISPNHPWNDNIESILKKPYLEIVVKDVNLSENQVDILSEGLFKFQSLILNNIFFGKEKIHVAKTFQIMSKAKNNIWKIDVSHNALGESFPEIFPLLRNVEILLLTNTGLFSDEFNLFLKEISKFSHLRSISCARNNFSDPLELDAFRPDLISLDISSCRIPKKQLNHLIIVLCKLISPIEINISDNGSNGIEDSVICDFCQALNRWPLLEKLGFGDIGLKSKQSDSIIRSLPRNLKYLNLSYCKLSKSSLDLMKDLTSLEILDITGNNLPEKIIDELKQILPQCKIVYDDEE